MIADRSWYDTAQICLNGHIVNLSAVRSPERNKPFCTRCGGKTITACPKCDVAIQGYYHIPGVFGLGGKEKASAYCHGCGSAYPWTVASLEAAKALTDEITGLDEQERLLLKASIDDLVSDTPKTPVAVTRFKKYATRGRKEIVQGLRDILVDIVSETARKGIWP